MTNPSLKLKSYIWNVIITWSNICKEMCLLVWKIITISSCKYMSNSYIFATSIQKQTDKINYVDYLKGSQYCGILVKCVLDMVLLERFALIDTGRVVVGNKNVKCIAQCRLLPWLPVIPVQWDGHWGEWHRFKYLSRNRESMEHGWECG